MTGQTVMDKRLLVLAGGMFSIGTDSFVVAGVLPQVSASFGVPVALAGASGCCSPAS